MATDSTLLKSIAKALWYTQDLSESRRMLPEILIRIHSYWNFFRHKSAVNAPELETEMSILRSRVG